MIGRLGRVPIYPILFAAYPILALFAQNAREVRASELAALLALAAAGAGAAWLLAGLLLKDAAKGALIAALAIVMFYSLGFVLEWAGALLTFLSDYWIHKPRVEAGPLWILALELLLLGYLGRRLAGRHPGRLRGATRFLNAVGVIAVVLSAIQALSVKAPAATRTPRSPAPLARLAPSTGRLPDIYYIILDGYARHDVLKSHFGLDNTPFLEHLESNGFFVARSSTANYAQTPLCLSASLNGTYLDGMVKGLANDQTELKEFIGHSDVMASLQPLGYRFVSFATGFEPTEHPEADRYLSPHPDMTEFQRMVVDMTPARVIWPDPRQMDRFRQARDRATYLLDHLPDVAKDPRPTFTFAHLLCPHPPIIFGANGEDVGNRLEPFMLFNRKVNGRFLRPEEFRRAYRDQVAYITRRVQETVDRILAESPEPPIIVVQSDHGSELELDMQSVDNTDLHERMNILNVYYFPDNLYQGLYDSISPVNSFRVVFNTFFGARLPMLPDRSYFSTWSEPYQFIDVTRIVRPAADGDAPEPHPGAGRDPRDS